MVCQLFDFKTTGMIFSSLASKPVATVSSSLASKSVTMVFRFSLKTARVGFSRPQNWWLRFSDLGIKIGSYSLLI
jgi:hypothetical protein